MKTVIIASALALSLGACALPETQQLRSDVNRALQTNHDARYKARLDRYESLAAARRTCTQQALKLETEGKYDKAQDQHVKCAKLAAETMPSLLTIETIKRGKKEFQDLTETASQ